MIYLDTSVALAELLAEDHKPDAAIWKERCISSRLLEYEVWFRINAMSLEKTHGAAARDLLARVSFIELSPIVLSRALAPFLVPVRTLDALHLASMDFMKTNRISFRLATFDDRLRTAAQALGFLEI